MGTTVAPVEQTEAKPVIGGEEMAEEVETRNVVGAIVIPDNEPVSLHPEIEPAFDHLVRISRTDAVECPVGGPTECPPRMPMCDQEDGEKLGMPCSEGDAEEQEEGTTNSTGSVEKLFRLFENFRRVTCDQALIKTLSRRQRRLMGGR